MSVCILILRPRMVSGWVLWFDGARDGRNRRFRVVKSAAQNAWELVEPAVSRLAATVDTTLAPDGFSDDDDDATTATASFGPGRRRPETFHRRRSIPALGVQTDKFYLALTRKRRLRIRFIYRYILHYV